jgi:hypothetical protein
MGSKQGKGLRNQVVRLIGSLAVMGAVVGASVGCLDVLVKARASGNEASAIASLRTIASSQMAYSVGECMGRYQPSLTALAAAGHLSPDLGAADTVEKMGYRITMTPSSNDAVADARQLAPACQSTVAGFTATAIPIQPGETGIRFFVTDERGEVRQATSATFADATPLQ